MEQEKAQPKLSLNELSKLRSSLLEMEPSAIFGLPEETFNQEEDTMPTHARSYSIIMKALEGIPLDSWKLLGLDETNQKPEFSDFEKVTDGLSIEDKMRFRVILVGYLQALDMARSLFNKGTSERNSIESAISWLHQMRNTTSSYESLFDFNPQLYLNTALEFDIDADSERIAEMEAFNTRLARIRMALNPYLKPKRK
jgi:hypothetical protein